jgi:Tol biopolymer transport system component
VNNGGAQIEGYSRALSPSAISSDGRLVAFAVATPVSIDGSNPGIGGDVFVRDRTLGTTSLISKSTAGVAANSSSDEVAISPNGRYVVFRSFATNLVASSSGSRIYVRDRQNDTTTNMPLPLGANNCEDPRVSDLGDIVSQCNMAAASPQAFLYDPAGAGAFYQLSTSLTATNGNGSSGAYTSISANGRLMVFDSAASDLVLNDTNNVADVFVVIPEPDAASGCLVAVSALAVAARGRSKRRSR